MIFILLLIILIVLMVILIFKLVDVKGMKDKDVVVVNVCVNLYWWEFEYFN